MAIARCAVLCCAVLQLVTTSLCRDRATAQGIRVHKLCMVRLTACRKRRSVRRGPPQEPLSEWIPRHEFDAVLWCLPLRTVNVAARWRALVTGFLSVGRFPGPCTSAAERCVLRAADLQGGIRAGVWRSWGTRGHVARPGL